MFAGVLIGILPLALVLLVQQTPFRLASVTGDYLTAAGIVWAVISLLISLDPSFKDKLDILKTSLSMVPGIGNE